MLLGSGERVSGEEVREQNVQAAVAIANIVKTSLGPHGLDKMMVDDIGVSSLSLHTSPFLPKISSLSPQAYRSLEEQRVDLSRFDHRMLRFRMMELRFFS